MTVTTVRQLVWLCPIGTGRQLSSDKYISYEMDNWISILLLCLTGIGEVQAQNDPVLAGMIAVYTESREGAEESGKVMLMQTTGHIWTKKKCRRQQTCNESLITI